MQKIWNHGSHVTEKLPLAMKILLPTVWKETFVREHLVLVVLQGAVVCGHWLRVVLHKSAVWKHLLRAFCIGLLFGNIGFMHFA